MLGESRLRLIRPPWLLAGALALAAAFILFETRGQSLLFDEWSFFADYRGHSPSVLLNPFGDNLELIPVVVYKLVFEAFGPQSVVLRLLTVTLNLACAALFYRLLEPRIGGWIAAAAATLLAVLGAAADVVAASLGLAIMLAVACGLGALLAIERDDGPGDRIACLLLTAALASNSVGLPFAVGAAVHIAFVSPRPRWPRWWVIGVPLLLYLAWRLWALHLDPLGPLAAHPTQITLSNIGSLPTSIADSLAAAILSVTGIYTEPGISARTFSTDFGPSLAVALVALLALRCGRPPALDRRALVYLAMPLTYWALIALVASDRQPALSRYQFAGAIFLLLLCAELARGLHIPARLRAAVVAGLLISVAPNAYNLHQDSNLLRFNSEIDRAELSAIEISRDRVPYELLVEPVGGRFDPASPTLYSGGEFARTTDAVISAGHYLSAADAFGSAAYSEAELLAGPPYAREAADKELAAALGPQLVPSRGRGSDCRTVRSAVPAVLDMALPPAGANIRVAAGGSAGLSLRRFGDAFSIPVGSVPAASALDLPLPADGSSHPWSARIEYSGDVKVCAIG